MIPLRDDAPRYSTPGVTWFLILLNVVVFLFEVSLPVGQRDAFLFQFGVTPAAFTHYANPPWPTLLTSMFLHGSWLHLGFNMLFLWIFGDNVEDYLGHFKYLMFYLACGVAAAGLQILLTADSKIPSVGASGAIAGVLGAYFVLFPSARVFTWLFFVFFVWLPAWVFLGYWFVVQFLSGAATAIAVTQNTQGSGGIAFWAHVGGFGAGLILGRMLPGRESYPRLHRY